MEFSGANGRIECAGANAQAERQAERQARSKLGESGRAQGASMTRDSECVAGNCRLKYAGGGVESDRRARYTRISRWLGFGQAKRPGQASQTSMARKEK